TFTEELGVTPSDRRGSAELLISGAMGGHFGPCPSTLPGVPISRNGADTPPTDRTNSGKSILVAPRGLCRTRVTEPIPEISGLDPIPRPGLLEGLSSRHRASASRSRRTSSRQLMARCMTSDRERPYWLA